MKRLAAVFVAALLGSGCDFDDDDCFGTVTVEWFGNFVLPSGGVPVGCGAAGVDFIDIFIDGQPVDQRFLCSDGGATIVGLRRGTHLFTVEGVQANSFSEPGLIVNRHEFDIDARCGDAVVRVQPAAGFANLDYTTNFTGCSASGPIDCFLWFSVFDVVANTVTSAVTKVSSDAVKQTFPYADDVVIELPAGPHTLQWMELVAAGTYLPQATRCTATPFDVVGGQAILTPEIPLAAGGPACH